MPDYIYFSEDKLKQFKAEYDFALENHKLFFKFERKTIKLTDARYMIEYLENQVFKKTETNAG